MGFVKKLREAAETIKQIVDEEAPRPKPKPEPKKDDGQKGGSK